MVRPSYVLGGRAMEIVYEKSQLKNFVEEAFKAAEKNPILIDKFLDHAMEVDVDAISCLLYTSPSPRDATLSRMPSSA